MTLSFIVAISDNNAIGINNTLPWHLPEDLKFFKRTTMGKPVVMGRKTFDSLGRPLPGRLNIVLSGNPKLELPEGVQLFTDIKTAISSLEVAGVEEAFIIGGGEIFKRTLDVVDCMYITRVHCTIEDADVFFPPVDHTHWKRTWIEAHDADEKHKYSYTFERYDRIEF